MALGSEQAARRAAQSILAEGRFHQSSVPDPLRSALVWLGKAINDPFSAFGNLINRAGSSFPGGVAGLWVIGAAVVILVTTLAVRRRARTRLGREPQSAGGPRVRPTELERAADQAEREGRWDEAVRLRFKAGLLRLGEREGLTWAQTTPNHSLAQKLDSQPLERLSSRFDEIVYGGDPATATDAERQRQEWPAIIAGAEH